MNGSHCTKVRLSAITNTDGSVKPFYLARAFKYESGDCFELTICTSPILTAGHRLQNSSSGGTWSGKAIIR